MGNNENNWQTFGHDNVKRALNSQLQADSIAHAYLFVGPSGIGKLSLVKEFANLLVQQTQNKNVSHNIDEHDLSEHGSLDEVREMLKFASLTPISGKKKVVILNNIHSIADSAASALLKTLEEPNGHTIFLLVSHKARIMQTIMSRCRVVNMGRLSQKQMIAMAAANDWVVNDAAVQIAGGNPAVLKAWALGDENYIEIMRRVDEIEAVASGGGDFEKMDLIKAFSELEDDKLEKILTAYINKQVVVLNEKPQRFAAIRTSVEAIQRLQRNFNKKMVLNYFVTNI